MLIDIWSNFESLREAKLGWCTLLLSSKVHRHPKKPSFFVDIYGGIMGEFD